ncbi:aminotransferase class I/II-fold pyridoxal phosphate-dependent enzyme [uncultured Shewanella sp.]|uniref:pyridoxal phosphate-dependent aminotransferase n=1 Tax=uncultured Shewanella sp. TaxID=173975 RepID=UPI002610B9E2|nr:aminotransferase class I/II-fold pyridoxal phosphate-dependent enzyme [uncultured Shewanella sp.]
MELEQSLALNIRDLMPYKAGMTKRELQREKGLNRVDKFASNESPKGLSAYIKDEIYSSLEEAHCYPDYQQLREAIANNANVMESQVILGNGSIDVIELAFRLMAKKGGHLLCSEFGYFSYPLLAQAVGLGIKTVPSGQQFCHEIQHLLAQCNSQTAIIALDSPSNMSGQMLSIKQLTDLLTVVPKHVLVLLDQAYIEFAHEAISQASVRLLKTFDNLLITRTFSKAYGLAGLRVGYGLANVKLIDWLSRLQRPFPIAGMAATAAVASLQDPEHLQQILMQVNEGKHFLIDKLTELGFKIINGEGNFILILLNEDDFELSEFLLTQGIIVRAMGSYKRPDLVRVSVSTPESHYRLVDAIKRFQSRKRLAG